MICTVICMEQRLTGVYNYMVGYIKGLVLRPNRTYRLSLSVLGGSVNVYLSSRGVPAGNLCNYTEPCTEWQPFSLEFTTEDSAKLESFSEWGIAFIKNNVPPMHTDLADTYIDNVRLTDIESNEEIVFGGDFEKPINHPIYECNWNKHILGSNGKIYGIKIVSDPTNNANRCLLLPRQSRMALSFLSPLSVDTFGWLINNTEDATCVGYIDVLLFILVKQGQVTVEHDGNIITANSGELVVLYPDHITPYTLHRGKDTAYYRLSIIGDAAEDLCKTLQLHAPSVLSLNNPDLLIQYITAMSQIPPHLSTKSLAINGLLFQYLAELEYQLTPTTYCAKYAETIEQAAAQLRAEPEKAIDNQTLSEIYGLSKTHFINLFRTHTGLTPQQYRIRHLIGKADTLLKETTMSIKNIAYSLDIDDPQYFSRLFRSVHGITPREYRSRYKK